MVVVRGRRYQIPKWPDETHGIIMERYNDYFYHQFMHNMVDVFIINYFFPHDYIQRHVLKRDIRASRC